MVVGEVEGEKDDVIIFQFQKIEKKNSITHNQEKEHSRLKELKCGF